MTVAAHSASQRRFSSPPAARRSMTALTSRRHRSSFDRRAGTRPVHLRDQPRPTLSVPPARLRLTGHRRDKRALSAILKSP